MREMALSQNGRPPTWHWSRRNPPGSLGSTVASLRGKARPIQSQHEVLAVRQLVPLRCVPLHVSATAPTCFAEKSVSHRRRPNLTLRGPLDYIRRQFELRSITGQAGPAPPQRESRTLPSPYHAAYPQSGLLQSPHALLLRPSVALETDGCQ